MLSLLWEYLGERFESVGDRIALAVTKRLQKAVIGLVFLWLGGLHFFLAVSFLALAIFFELANLPWRDAALWVSGGLGVWSLFLGYVGANQLGKK